MIEGKQTMRQNHVKAQLKAGKPSIGTWLSFPSPEVVELMATVGFDWLTIDWEHNAIDRETMAQMMAAMRGSGSAPMVRIPEGTHQIIKMCLDAGAWGIVAPMVNTVEEAVLIARAAKHPPLGNRSFGGGRYNASWGATRDEYTKNANNEVAVILMMESPQGINNLEKMIEECEQYGGIDGAFIGPNDLLGQMHKTPAMWTDDPEFVDAVQHVLQTCKKHGKAAGIHCGDAKAVSDRIADGFQWLALASEARFMMHEAALEIAAVKGWQPTSTGEVVRY